MVACLLLIVLTLSIPRGIGAGYQRAYWSSSYLPAHRDDFADSAKLEAMERIQTNLREPYKMEPLYAPWGNVIGKQIVRLLHHVSGTFSQMTC